MAIGRVLTANRLNDGAVVFLTPAGAWSENIDEAVLGSEPPATGILEKQGAYFEAANVVTGAYLIQAQRRGSSITPAHVRERIRARGPTVAYLRERPSSCSAQASA